MLGTPCLCGSSLSQFPAQFAFEDFPDAALGQLQAENDLGRYAELVDEAAGVLAQLGFVRRMTGSQNDHGADLFAERRIWQTDYGDFGHGRMRV